MCVLVCRDGCACVCRGCVSVWWGFVCCDCVFSCGGMLACSLWIVCCVGVFLCADCCDCDSCCDCVDVGVVGVGA